MTNNKYLCSPREIGKAVISQGKSAFICGLFLGVNSCEFVVNLKKQSQSVRNELPDRFDQGC